jgi:acylglycerol lipase
MKIYGNNIKYFLAGLSMGGMTSYRLSLENPEKFAGTILMAPAI